MATYFASKRKGEYSTNSLNNKAKMATCFASKRKGEYSTNSLNNKAKWLPTLPVRGRENIVQIP